MGTQRPTVFHALQISNVLSQIQGPQFLLLTEIRAVSGAKIFVAVAVAVYFPNNRNDVPFFHTSHFLFKTQEHSGAPNVIRFQKQIVKKHTFQPSCRSLASRNTPGIYSILYPLRMQSSK